jgi:hypothetical protein
MKGVYISQKWKLQFPHMFPRMPFRFCFHFHQRISFSFFSAKKNLFFRLAKSIFIPLPLFHGKVDFFCSTFIPMTLWYTLWTCGNLGRLYRCFSVIFQSRQSGWELRLKKGKMSTADFFLRVVNSRCIALIQLSVWPMLAAHWPDVSGLVTCGWVPGG